MITIFGHIIQPTMFPDNTSQVWKLPFKIDKTLREKYNKGSVTIDWQYDKESELIHIAQLNDLLQRYYKVATILNVPYLPYARQDKLISNESTFALRTFARLINSMNFFQVRTVDVHSEEAHCIEKLFIEPASTYFKPSKDTVLCYPDSGAAGRYMSQFPHNDYIILEKKRNQLTGEIERIEIQVGNDIPDIKKICIIDDICDGGRTFIEAAKLLKALEPKEIHLYVSHGIFSKGLKQLVDAGISRIFTHKGEVDIKSHLATLEDIT